MFTRLVILIWSLSSLCANSQSIIPAIKPKALVELFTSQGCSSCPSAHQVVEKIYEDPAFGHDSVLILSFHVDYWDDLGWKDTLAKKQFTTRQKKYQELFNSEGVYTPQFVVDGRSGFSGNNEPRLRRELKTIYSASKLMNTGLKLSELSSDNLSLIFTYLVDGNAEDKMLHAAIISLLDTTIINGGENSGLTLTSRNVVLNMLQLPLKTTGSRAFVNIPKGIEIEKLKLVLWVQDSNTAQVMDILMYDFPN